MLQGVHTTTSETQGNFQPTAQNSSFRQTGGVQEARARKGIGQVSFPGPTLTWTEMYIHIHFYTPSLPKETVSGGLFGSELKVCLFVLF